jgi:hypothetical protein
MKAAILTAIQMAKTKKNSELRIKNLETKVANERPE